MRAWSLRTLRERVIETFKEFGGWWRIEGMAEWLDAPVGHIRKVWEELETEGLLERKQGKC